MTPALKTIAAAAWLATLTATQPGWAQSAPPATAQGALREAAQKAINANPEVTSRFNAVRAAGNEIDVARGGLRPRVDLSAEGGYTEEKFSNRSPETTDYTRTGLALSVNQLIWDGRVTSREVHRLGHARMTRYFEFADASEQAALEAARAFYDVQRYRRLVQLAEDNYVQHKVTADQLGQRQKAGVGRGVDAEQSNARLALAESNLTTELANLHDVMARYQRIVGDTPPTVAGSVRLAEGLPASADAAAGNAVQRNASISAAVENLRAVRTQLEQRKAQQWQPKLEARLRSGVGHNFDGTVDQKRDTTGLLVLNWNLYNGGADDARVRQYADLLNQAADLRDKACRDVRQTAAIAYNDIAKLTAQLLELGRNVQAIQKARDAYRQQFDIGQRNLLDVLNAENELYTARRAYANAEFDLDLAYARVHATNNSLLSALGLQRPATQEGSDDPAANWQAGDDAAARCPLTTLEAPGFNKAELDARAAQMLASGRKAEPAAAPAQAKPAAAPAPLAAVEQRLADWAAAWSAKDADRYLGFYASGFSGKQPRAQWEAQRRQRVTKPGPIAVQVSDVKSRALDGDRVETRFKQVYTSQGFSDTTQKSLVWQQEGGAWKIVRESNR